MRKYLFILAAVLMGTSAMAQNDSSAVKRKKVAVVLSGGGAKGMAHIGALRVIERVSIPSATTHSRSTRWCVCRTGAMSSPTRRT